MIKLYEIIEKPLSGEWGKDDDSGEGIPVLRTTNFTNIGVVNYKNVITRIVDANKAKEKFLRKGDIIIEKSGGSPSQPVGRVVFFEGEDNKYLCNNFTSVLRVKDKNNYYNKYLFYHLFLNYKMGATRKFQNKTTGILNLKLDRYIKETEIKKHLNENQKQIAKTLDTAAELLAMRKQQLAELDNLIKSTFYDMFGDPLINEKGWDKKLWGEVFNTTTGKLDANAMCEDGLYTFFTCSKEVYRINDFAFDCEALLLAGNNATANYDVKYYNGKFNAYQRTYVITLKDPINEYFLFQYLLEQKLKLMQSNSKGTNTKYLTMGILGRFDFIIPPIYIQAKFTEIVTKTEEQKALVKKAIDETQYLFDSFMSEYFE